MPRYTWANSIYFAQFVNTMKIMKYARKHELFENSAT